MPYYHVKTGDTLLTDMYVILQHDRSTGEWTRWTRPYDEDGEYFSDEADELIEKESSHYRPMKKARIVWEVK